MAGQIIPAIIGGAKVLSKIPAVKESAKAIAKALKRRKRKQDKKSTSKNTKQKDMFQKEKDVAKKKSDDHYKAMQEYREKMVKYQEGKGKKPDYPTKDMKYSKRVDNESQTMEYNEGGPVKKCKVDGIATKGFTRAKHK